MGFVNFKPLSKCGMEELAAHVRGSNSQTGGILFARNKDGDEKKKSRQLVLDLFAPEVWPGHLRILTMPGSRWIFERQLLALREGPGWSRSASSGGTFFTSVESDRAIYFSACTTMPGVESNRRSRVRSLKKNPFAEFGVGNDFAAFFFTDVESLMAYAIDCWYPLDAAWLDFTGPMTPQRLSLLRQFYKKCVRKILVVTMLKGRESKSATRSLKDHASRGRWLSDNLSGEILHDIEYFDTSAMVQFAVERTDADGLNPEIKGFASLTVGIR